MVAVTVCLCVHLRLVNCGLRAQLSVHCTSHAAVHASDPMFATYTPHSRHRTRYISSNHLLLFCCAPSHLLPSIIRRRRLPQRYMAEIASQRELKSALYEQQKLEEMRAVEEGRRREEFKRRVIEEARRKLLEEHASKLRGGWRVWDVICVVVTVLLRVSPAFCQLLHSADGVRTLVCRAGVGIILIGRPGSRVVRIPYPSQHHP